MHGHHSVCRHASSPVVLPSAAHSFKKVVALVLDTSCCPLSGAQSTTNPHNSSHRRKCDWLSFMPFCLLVQPMLQAALCETDAYCPSALGPRPEMLQTVVSKRLLLLASKVVWIPAKSAILWLIYLLTRKYSSKHWYCNHFGVWRAFG